MNKPQPKEREIRTLVTKEFRVSTATDGTRTLCGIIPYNSRSADLGGWTEMIAPGAFAFALEANADVLCLRDHQPAILLGRTKAKTLSLIDTEQGLQFNCKLPNTSQATDLIESIDRGDLDGNSFGFVTLDDKWICDETGQVLRTLLSVELWEISPCSFPAYLASQVAVRSCPPEIRSLIDGAAKRSNADSCSCDCAECLADNCQDCSDPACNDPQCAADRALHLRQRVHLQRVKLALSALA